MSCLDRSMFSFVSISYAQRLLSPPTATGLPYTFWSSRPLRLWTGLVDASRVRLPCRARCSAVAPPITVFPTPPFPPKKVYLRFGPPSMYALSDPSMPPPTPPLPPPMRGSAPAVAIHDGGELFDHREAGHVALELRHVADELAGEPLLDLLQVAALHREAVPQVGRHLLVGELRRQDPVHDIPRDRDVELGEQLGGLLGVQDDHLLGHDDEEKRGALLIGQDAGRFVDASTDVQQLVQDLVFLGDRLALDPRHHLLVLPHLLPELGDAVDPFVVHLGHREVIQGMAEGDEVVDVVVVVALHHDVDDRVEDRRLLHRRLRRGSLDVVLDFLRDLLEAVHVDDLLADFLLIRLDVRVGVDLLRPEVLDDFDGALAEDVAL